MTKDSDIVEQVNDVLWCLEDMKITREQAAQQINQLYRKHYRERLIEAVALTIRKYGTNSVAFIHSGDDDVKIIKAIKQELGDE